MPARYVRPYSKGQKNDFGDAEAIGEAVQRPTMNFVTTPDLGSHGTSVSAQRQVSLCTLQMKRPPHGGLF
jgi:transposase